jgi:hypothetical protein
MKRDLSRIKVKCCACKKCRCNQQHHPRDYGKPHFAVFLKLQLDRESWTCAEIKAETALMSRVFASEPGQMLKSVWLYARHPIGFAGSAVAGLMRRSLCLSAKRFTFMQPISICKGRIDLAGTSRKIRFWAGSLSASWPPWGVIPAFLAIQARQGARREVDGTACRIEVTWGVRFGFLDACGAASRHAANCSRFRQSGFERSHCSPLQWRERPGPKLDLPDRGRTELRRSASNIRGLKVLVRVKTNQRPPLTVFF